MARQSITSSSTAEYFSKNLQQVGFSSGTKAVLTTLKEAVDNSMDACEDAGILPEIDVEIEKLGAGSHKNWDLIRVKVTDNGPGIAPDDLIRVFGEYLASSKFGRGRCSRGQQGIGISAATTWAQLTSTEGARVISKTNKMRQAVSGIVEVDIKQNKGVIRDKKSIDWDRPNGVSVEFRFDGRLQLNGEGGLITYLAGTSLVNPHLKLRYRINKEPWITLDRVSKDPVEIPDAILPHPHTLKLGEFIAHANLFGKVTLSHYLRKGFSRIGDDTLKEFVKNGLPKPLLEKNVPVLNQDEFNKTFSAIQKTELMAPSTRSVLRIGEESLSKSIRRLGEIDFFSVISRKPRICDAKPVVIEVAIARFIKGGRSAVSRDESESEPVTVAMKKSKGKKDDSQASLFDQNEASGAKNSSGKKDVVVVQSTGFAQTNVTQSEEEPATVLRFANRVPLQFDKAACAISKAIESVNWRAYGLNQPKNSVPLGPYVIAVSVVSPFIKFKNASKETIDASGELVEEIRLALIQAGQKLARHIRSEKKAQELEDKIRHIEQFAPILIKILGEITEAPKTKLSRAEEGLRKILGRDTQEAEQELRDAIEKKEALQARSKPNKDSSEDSADFGAEVEQDTPSEETESKAPTAKKTKGK